MAAPAELWQAFDAFYQQIQVDRNKKAITPEQSVDFLMSHLNGYRANGLLTDAEGYDASYTWTEALNWYLSVGFSAEYTIVGDINGGGGWEVWPLTITGVAP